MSHGRAKCVFDFSLTQQQFGLLARLGGGFESHLKGAEPENTRRLVSTSFLSEKNKYLLESGPVGDDHISCVVFLGELQEVLDGLQRRRTGRKLHSGWKELRIAEFCFFSGIITNTLPNLIDDSAWSVTRPAIYRYLKNKVTSSPVVS